MKTLAVENAFTDRCRKIERLARIEELSRIAKDVLLKLDFKLEWAIRLKQVPMNLKETRAELKKATFQQWMLRQIDMEKGRKID